MADLSFEREEMVQSMIHGISSGQGTGNNLETIMSSNQHIIDLNESDRSIVRLDLIINCNL